MPQRLKYLVLLLIFLVPLSINRLSAQDIKSLKRAFLDMVYVPQQERFYAVSSAYGSPTKSLLFRINPYTATIEDSVQVGYYVHKLVVTDDGRFLYIAEKGSSVYRFDLALKKVVLTIKLTKPRPQDSISTVVIAAVPQTPNSVVVIVDSYTGNSLNTVLLVENTTIAATSGSNSEYNGLAFGKNPNILYVYDAGSTGEALTVMRRQGALWQPIRNYLHFVGTFSGNTKVDEEGFLYGTRGPFRLKLVNVVPLCQ